MAVDFADYLTPDFKNPGPEMAPSPITGLPAGLDPIWGPISRALFGKSKKKKDKWVEKDGMMYHTSGQYAPVPISDVYGTAKTPSKEYRQVGEQIRILEDFLPSYSKAIAGQLIPQEQAKLEAAKATSPQMAELMTQLYKTYGPQLNKIGNEIALTNAMAAAERDKSVLEGPGKDLVKQALETAKIYDPEFFATREKTAGRLGELMDSIDLEGDLSPTERREIAQRLELENQERGTAGAPSQTETVANAMRYGEAGRKRVLENQGALGNAIMAASNFLPASRSGVDVFQVATGKTSMPNTGESKFTGVNMPGQEAYQLAGGLFGNIGNASTQQADIKATAKLNEKDWLDQFQQFTSGLSNLGGLMGGAMMCWVAREVYGIDNPSWLTFRNWMFTAAPTWLFNFYAKHGQGISLFIRNKPRIKRILRYWMDSKIK